MYELKNLQNLNKLAIYTQLNMLFSLSPSLVQLWKFNFETLVLENRSRYWKWNTMTWNPLPVEG